MPEKPALDEIYDFIVGFVRQPKVAAFRIGVTTNPMRQRLGDQSHSLDGFNHHEILHEDMDRTKVLNWEAQLQVMLDADLKYDKAGKRRVRSLGQKAPYLLYLAWRHTDWRPEHNPRTWAANRALIEEAKRQTADTPGRLTMHPNDRSYREALDGPPMFVIAIGKLTVHLRWTICRYAWSSHKTNVGPTPGGLKKLTGPRLGELIASAEEWVEQHRPRLKNQGRWHLCPCGCMAARGRSSGVPVR
jgi:hypothetical protein